MKKVIAIWSVVLLSVNFGHGAFADEGKEELKTTPVESVESDQEDIAALDSNDGYFLADNGLAPLSSVDTSSINGGNDAGGKRSGFSGPHHGPCAKVDLDEEQKKKMKEMIFKFRENKIDLEAQVKKAKLKLEHLMGDPAATEKAASSAAKNLNESISKLREAKSDLKTQIAFSILKPEQRAPAQMCHAMMKHGRHHRGFGERGFGDWANRGRGPQKRDTHQGVGRNSDSELAPSERS